VADKYDKNDDHVHEDEPVDTDLERHGGTSFLKRSLSGRPSWGCRDAADGMARTDRRLATVDRPTIPCEGATPCGPFATLGLAMNQPMDNLET
jgi:hypothetical protein